MIVVEALSVRRVRNCDRWVRARKTVGQRKERGRLPLYPCGTVSHITPETPATAIVLAVLVGSAGPDAPIPADRATPVTTPTVVSSVPRIDPRASRCAPKIALLGHKKRSLDGPGPMSIEWRFANSEEGIDACCDETEKSRVVALARGGDEVVATALVRVVENRGDEQLPQDLRNHPEAMIRKHFTLETPRLQYIVRRLVFAFRQGGATTLPATDVGPRLTLPGRYRSSATPGAGVRVTMNAHGA